MMAGSRGCDFYNVVETDCDFYNEWLLRALEADCDFYNEDTFFIIWIRNRTVSLCGGGV